MARDAFDFATVTMAALGSGLGIFNAWRTWVNDRVRIRVAVSRLIATDGQRAIGIEVVNLSAFDVTITHIGFDLVGTSDHLQLFKPLIAQGHALPKRLEPRAAFTVFQPLSAFEGKQLLQLDRAYVATACGLRPKSRRGSVAKLDLVAFAGRQTVD